MKNLFFSVSKKLCRKILAYRIRQRRKADRKLSSQGLEVYRKISITGCSFISLTDEEIIILFRFIAMLSKSELELAEILKKHPFHFPEFKFYKFKFEPNKRFSSWLAGCAVLKTKESFHAFIIGPKKNIITIW